jgi:hypothetical protein
MARKKKNLFGWGSAKKSRQTTPATGGIAASLARAKGSRTKASSFGGYSIRRTESGEYVIPKIDPDSRFEDLTQAKRFIRSYKSNPVKFDRCVKTVKKRGGAANAYAVCTAAGTRGKQRNARKRFWIVTDNGDLLNTYGTKAEAEKYLRLLKQQSPSITARVKDSHRENPANAAAQAFEEFHGRPSEEVVTVTQKIHYHGNLAAIGELKALIGVPVGGGKFTLKGFDGAILCENEEKTQLFVRGGNQKVPTEEWNFPAKKELYDLGEVRVVEYFTTKDHLGKKDGGTAIYVHKFDPPYPELIYDVKNKQLLFAGGGYSMPPEGIDH